MPVCLCKHCTVTQTILAKKVSVMGEKNTIELLLVKGPVNVEHLHHGKKSRDWKHIPFIAVYANHERSGTQTSYG